MQTILKSGFQSLKRKSSSPLPHLVAVVAALALLAGCQSYRAEPLSLSEHKEGWLAQSPLGEKVHVFAKRLAGSAPDAAPFDPSNGLSLNEAEIVALVYNSDLRVARLRAGVTKATADFAGLWDDPEVSIDVLKITEGIPDPWVVSSALSITVPISGRLRVEKARAEAAMYAELDRVAEAEWRVRQDLRDAWVSWSAGRLRLEQTEQIVSELDSIIGATSKLAEGGEMLKTEAALFTIERVSRRAELEQLKGELAEESQKIRTLLGLSTGAPVTLIPTLSAVGNPPGDAIPDETNLTLARLRSEYEVAEQTLAVEVRKQYPDLTIGPKAEGDQGQSRIGFIGAIPLPILNSNKGGIAEARAGREVARAVFEAEYEQIMGRLASLRARQQGTRARRKTMDESLVPMVDRQVGDARRLVELGEGGSLVLLESVVRAHEAKLKLIEIQLEDGLANNEIRFLIGPEGSQPTPKKK